MCKVSDKLKLCTCGVDDINELPHYWILYKYADKGIWRVGQPIFPAVIGERTETHNIDTLQKLLNDGNCFDFEVKLEENDRLVFTFTCVDNANMMVSSHRGNYLEYTFVWKNGAWIIGDWNPFRINLDEKLKGEILNPLKVRKRK